MSKRRLTDYLALSDDNLWIIQDLLPVGGKLNIMGESKVGKSFLGLQLAEALSQAMQPRWLGYFPVVQKGEVVYLQIDTSRSVWQDRLKRVQTTLDLTHIDLFDKLDLPPMFDINKTKHFNKLAGLIGWEEDEKPLAVIVDVIRAVHRGSEDDSGNMQDVIDALELACYPAALVIISHTRKPPTDRRMARDNADSMNEQRGSSALNGSVDTLLKLTPNYIYAEPRSAEKFKLPVRQGAQGLWEVRQTAAPPVTQLNAQQLLNLVSQVVANGALRTKVEKRNALMAFGVSAEQARKAVP